MTTVAVLADPPVEGVVLENLVADGPLESAQAVDLYVTMLADVCEAVRGSGAELLVNYRSGDQLGAAVDDPETAVRSALTETLSGAGSLRYEVQVGSSYHARVGNTITHLLREEDTRTAAVVTPTAPFLGRRHVDSAAMKLRQSDVVLGPSTDGRVYYAGFSEPIDFAEAFESPAVETLVERATDEGLDVDFLPMLPKLEHPGDLKTATPVVSARRTAGKSVPERTSECMTSLDLDPA